MPSPLPTLPKTPKDRFEVHRLFNGLSEEGKEGLDHGRLRVPLVKTFLLEHVSARNGGKSKPLAEIWERLHGEPTQVDDAFFSVQGVVKEPESGQPKKVTVGYVEQYHERFFAYYTVEDSVSAKRRVSSWVTGSPDLDFAWFSSPFLKALWDQDVSHRGDQRFTKMAFRHDSIFELPEDATSETGEDAGDERPVGESEAEERFEPERRKVRSEMGDCIGRLRESLENLQRSYSPLHALYALRIPSQSSRGGHDVFQHGQLTNRSDSFEDHRNTARYLYRIYNSVLESTEDAAWGEVNSNGTQSVGWKGTPLIVRFGEPLSPSTFEHWISRAFQKRNVFKLWGEPLRLGPTKVHVYGADRHIWQPLNLEITESQLVAILPQGTCGNTFHRLVANLQRYVAPEIEAWIGAKRFNAFVEMKDFRSEDHAS